nr:LytTR family DNA-binding domain-containing protein [Flavobacterium sp. ASV13]
MNLAAPKTTPNQFVNSEIMLAEPQKPAGSVMHHATWNPQVMGGYDNSHPLIAYFDNLLSKMEAPKYKSSFLVFKAGKYTNIQTKDIAFFYIKNDAPTIMGFDKKEYTVTLSLDEIHKIVSPSKFFRINRQYVISFSSIKEVEHYFSRKLILKLLFPTEEKLLIGKDKATAFLNWMENR